MFCGMENCGSGRSCKIQRRDSMDTLDSADSYPNPAYRHTYIAQAFDQYPMNSLTRSASLPTPVMNRTPALPAKTGSNGLSGHFPGYTGTHLTKTGSEPWDANFQDPYGLSSLPSGSPLMARRQLESLIGSLSQPGSPMGTRKQPGSPMGARKQLGSPNGSKNRSPMGSRKQVLSSSTRSSKRSPLLPRKSRVTPRSPGVPPKTRVVIARKHGSHLVHHMLEVSMDIILSDKCFPFHYLSQKLLQ